MDSSYRTPFGLKWRSSPLFVCFTVGMGMFTDLFLYSLIVPVLPFVLEDRIQVPRSDVQSIISNLLATYAGAAVLACPVTGVIADKYSSSRKLPFLVGLLCVLISTILLAVGKSIQVLIIARALQGTSGSIVWTIGLAILVETVGQENLGKAVGSIFSVITVATLFAPIVGGALYSTAGYTAVFGVGVAAVLIDLVMRLLMLEKKVAVQFGPQKTQASPSLDDRRVSATESSPLLPDIAPADSPNTNPYRLNPPRHKITKNLPFLLLLAVPGLLTALFIGFMQAFLFSAFDATIPLIASTQYGFDSFQAGLLFISLGAMSLLFSPLGGWCVDRWGTRPISIIGFLWLVPSLVLLRLPASNLVSEHLERGQEIALYVILLGLNGFGLAIVNSTATVESSRILEKYYDANKDLFVQPPYAQLYASSSMFWNAGLTVGPLVAGSLKVRIGYGNMNAVLGGFCAVTTMLVTLFVEKKDA